VHAAQHVGQHGIGLDLQVVGLEFDGDMAVAQVVCGARQIKGAAVFGTGADDHHGLRSGLDTHQAAIVSDQHIAAPHRAATRQEDAQAAALAIGGVKAALLAHIPIQLNLGGTFEQHGGQAFAAGNEFGEGQHGVSVGFGGCCRRLASRVLWWPVNADIITKVLTRFCMHTLKLMQIGNSVGVILPKELLAQLKVEKGGSLFVTEAANGIVLTPYDPSLEGQLDAGREFMREFRDTFHQLAK
jgi:putative addiction module antidote